jgi:hypothetical protein
LYYVVSQSFGMFSNITPNSDNFAVSLLNMNISADMSVVNLLLYLFF